MVSAILAKRKIKRDGKCIMPMSTRSLDQTRKILQSEKGSGLEDFWNSGSSTYRLKHRNNPFALHPLCKENSL